MPSYNLRQESIWHAPPTRDEQSCYDWVEHAGVPDLNPALFVNCMTCDYSAECSRLLLERAQPGDVPISDCPAAFAIPTADLLALTDEDVDAPCTDSDLPFWQDHPPLRKGRDRPKGASGVDGPIPCPC